MRKENAKLQECLQDTCKQSSTDSEYLSNSSSFFAAHLQVKNLSPYHMELYSEKVCNAVELVSTEVQWKGTLYRKGSFLCMKNDNSVEFGQIELILMKGNKYVYFLVTPHCSSYLAEYGLYHVGEAVKQMFCINAEHCLDFYPLAAYSLCGMTVLSLKHSVLDQ